MPHTRAGHACRVNIPAIVAFVHLFYAPPALAGPDRLGFFLCADCRNQVVVCSGCDRGQVYCAGDCARRARQATAAAGRKALPKRTERAAATCRAATPLPGAAQKSDASRFTPATAR